MANQEKKSHYAGFTSLHVKTSALILPFPFVSATSAQKIVA